MISITGRRPHTALPNAAPARASSEIGVSKTRSGPKRSKSSGLVTNTPPAAATSSPKKITRSSRSSSSARASRTATRNSTSATGELPGGSIRRRVRRGQSVLRQFLDLRLDRRLELLQLGRIDVLTEHRSRTKKRISLPPGVELPGLAVLPRVAARVAHEAVGHRLDEARALARPRPLDRRARSLLNGPHVVAVHGGRTDLERLGPCADLAGGDLLERRELAVEVVLADVERGQLEDLGEVEALGEVALVGGAVAEERHGHAPLTLERERRAGGGGDAAAHDPEAADQPVLEVDHVHRPGAAGAHTGRAPEQLVQQSLRVHAEGQRVAVPAIGPRRAVLRLEHGAHPRRHRLLPRVEMRRAVHLALQEQRLHRVLEAADQQHPPVELEPLGRVRPSALLCRLRAAHLAATPSSFTRSAPRTYCLPATSSSSPGKRVRISGPSAVTSTSSSMRAAERPSVAGQ